MKDIRPLTADEVEVRIGTVGEKGVTFLLYKNARTDMQVLDEVFGTWNWQRDHKDVKGNMYCGIGIWDEKKQCWVWKWDCGTESNTEKEKGEASDSFKRAGTNWGIGRELYDSPLIWLPAATVKKNNGYGYELANKREMYGIYVSDLVVEEKDGKRYVASVTLSQNSSELGTFKHKGGR